MVVINGTAELCLPDQQSKETRNGTVLIGEIVLHDSDRP